MKLTGSPLVEYLYPFTLLGFLLSALTLTLLFWWVHGSTVMAAASWIGSHLDHAMYAIVDALMGCKSAVVMKDGLVLRELAKDRVCTRKPLYTEPKLSIHEMEQEIRAYDARWAKLSQHIENLMVHAHMSYEDALELALRTEKRNGSSD